MLNREEVEAVASRLLKRRRGKREKEGKGEKKEEGEGEEKEKMEYLRAINY